MLFLVSDIIAAWSVCLTLELKELYIAQSNAIWDDWSNTTNVRIVCTGTEPAPDLMQWGMPMSMFNYIG
jgi:hypothetical protein